MRKVRIYSREFKLSILQELETKSMAKVSRAYNISSSTISGGKKTFKNNPKNAFKGKGNKYKEEAKIPKS